jgi:hypothetical protein
MLSKTKKVFAIVASVMVLSLTTNSAANANQTINIDLNNFQQDRLQFQYPAYDVYGITDNSQVIINVTNSIGPFLGYVNKSTGSSINVVATGVNATSPTGQFYEPNDVTSLALSNNIIGSYQVTLNFGATARLDTISTGDLGVAAYTNDPSNAAGFLILEWTFDGSGTWRVVSLLTSGTPRSSSSRTVNTLRLDSAGTTTEKSNVVSCTPGKYTFLNGGSTAETAKVQSYVYTLLVNGKAVSTLSSDGFKSVASHLFPTIAGNMAGTATLEGATWDLKGMSNYSAQCQVYATQSGGNIQSVTTTAHDAVALAAAAEVAAKAQMAKDMISNWALTNEELAKKYRDNRLAGKP